MPEHIRREYRSEGLEETALDAHPLRQFGEWFEAAAASEIAEPNAMALATATPAGAPSVRMVLLKGFDERGFVFYTSFESRKAAELEANPRAALAFYWAPLHRQVRIEGSVTRTDRTEAAEYFRTRPEGSRLGAWASRQSSVIADRAALDEALESAAERFRGGEIPLPPFWGGYRLRPDSIEFWQGRPNRLHDRLRYVRAAEGWLIERLSP